MRFFEKFVKPYKNLGEEQRLYALFIMNYEVCFFILPLISAVKNQVPIILVCLRAFAKHLSFLSFLHFSRQIAENKFRLKSTVLCGTAINFMKNVP